MLIIIDNYDSFTYNLVQYFGELGVEPTIFRNDEITIPELRELNPSAIVISPGPCTPLQAGISNDVIRTFGGKTPILGVCLGHQCIAYVHKGEIIRAPYLMHGRTSKIIHDNKTIFKGIENNFIATRYHSLIVNHENLPNCFEISSWTDDGLIMGIRHKELKKLEGVQFHPESILTTVGKSLLKNFLDLSI